MRWGNYSMHSPGKRIVEDILVVAIGKILYGVL